MKNQSIIARLNLSITVLFVFFLMLSSCTKEQRIAPYSPPSTPISETIYEMKDVYNGLERTYEMSLQTLEEGSSDQFILSNFGNYRIQVKAYVVNGQISIPTQNFFSEHYDLEIYNGTGTLTADDLKIKFWAREAGHEFSHELAGVFLR
ncbi:MAG: hypothetical protein DHS20C17_32760 [Cyclobacteriaceae bacterium]|nr:MAG: hypothetical protein DHS20C17_32760 [Cyclobacteriaceae bacterium]